MPTIRFRNGLWEGAVQIRGHRYWVSGHSRKEVLTKLQALQTGNHPPPNPQRSSLHLDRTGETSLETPNAPRLPETLLLPSPPLPLPPSSLSPQTITHLLQSLPSPRRKLAVYRLLHRALSLACRWGWLAENPCDSLPPPPYSPHTPSLWSPQHLETFILSIRSHWLGPLFLLLLDTGMRLGEVLGLEWGDVDEERGRARVERSVQVIGGRRVVVEPKTRAGRRWISLGPYGRWALEQQRLRTGGEGIIFRGVKGGELHLSTVQHALSRICRRLNIPRLTPHGLRHLSASLALQAGAPLPLVSRRLGHAGVHITTRIYAHALIDDEPVVRALETVLPPAGGEDSSGEEYC